MITSDAHEGLRDALSKEFLAGSRLSVDEDRSVVGRGFLRPVHYSFELFVFTEDIVEGI